MKRERKVTLYVIVISVAVAVFVSAAFRGALADLVAMALNRVTADKSYKVSDRAARLHKTLLAADLHCDALLWGRDLLKEGAWGHVDIPRMQAGNLGLQAFTVVTEMPLFAGLKGTADRFDVISVLATAKDWPARTRGSLKERALFQARNLHLVEEKSGGVFRVIKSREQLEQFLKDRASDPRLTAGLLGIEGMHCLENNLDNVNVMYDAGFRMMAPTHFFDNELGGSAQGVSGAGLTDFGRQVIRRMQTLHMLVDLAHASARMIDDVLSMATGAVVVSHTGVKGTCDNARTLTDEQIAGIAATGGVVGIGFWKQAVCATEPKAVARAIRYAADRIGADHVALGSDFDGSVAAPFDAAGLAQLTEALLRQGFTEAEIRKIMGENVLRVLRQVLP